MGPAGPSRAQAAPGGIEERDLPEHRPGTMGLCRGFAYRPWSPSRGPVFDKDAKRVSNRNIFLTSI